MANIFEIIRGYFSNDLVIELSENLVSIRAFDSDRKYEDVPIMAIENYKDSKIIAEIGPKAKKLSGPNIKIVNPFSHPRMLISNFFYAEKLLQHGIRILHNEQFLRPSPRVIMHQLEKNEGGLTDVEERALQELAIGAGAHEVLIYYGDKINTTIDNYESVKSRINAT